MGFWYGMRMDLEAKNYELAYMLSPAVPEESVLAEAARFGTLIEDAHGMVKRAETPKKRRLAYPIKKQANGYFGWTTFSMAPAEITALDKKVKEEKNLLRHLIVEEEIETRTPYVRPMGARRMPPGAEKTLPSASSQQPDAAPEVKLDLEALDKKLEEILGK